MIAAQINQSLSKSDIVSVDGNVIIDGHSGMLCFGPERVGAVFSDPGRRSRSYYDACGLMFYLWIKCLEIGNPNTVLRSSNCRRLNERILKLSLAWNLEGMMIHVPYLAPGIVMYVIKICHLMQNSFSSSLISAALDM
jgi:hypothetical protein